LWEAAAVLMLLDSASLYFRAFHGVPESVTAADGTPVNAVRGFLDMVAFLVKTRRPDRLVACLDLDWRPAFRVEAVPSYKAHRVSPKGGETVPDGLVPQVPILLEVLGALGLRTAGAEGFEADDVIGTLAAAATEPVEVVSGDRDLFQVVRDSPPVHVLYVGRGVRNLEVMGEDEVAAKYGVPGRGYADFAVLRGDPSDGLPGVKGVGEKSAAALVSRFGSLDALTSALDSGEESGFPAGSRTKLLAARDYLAAAPAVARVRTDAPVETGPDALPREPADPARLVDLAERWNLDSPLNRLLAALSTQD
jgi:5'-3' exonuclease